MALGVSQGLGTAIGLFHMSAGCFTDACNQCEVDLNNGTANIAAGLMYLNKALLAELTQMSQDIAALKAEVASLKPKPTGLQLSSYSLRR
jgi:hypothetical protein